MKERLHKYITLFLLVLFIAHYSNTHFFMHSHRVGDIQIVHSHYQFPDKNPLSASHTHTPAEFALIADLSYCQLLAADVFFYQPVIEQAGRFDYPDLEVSGVQMAYIYHFLLRAPPFYSLF